MTTPPVLLTFAPMIDSEFARLILRHHRVEYREADHLFGWVSLLALRHGGYGRVPLLYGGERPLTGPLPIAAALDRQVPAARRLMPGEEPLAETVAGDVQRFNGRFALDVAAFAYHHLLPARDLMLPVFAASLPARERRLLPALYRPTALLFRLLLRLSAGRAADALRRIDLLFDETAARVADGRPFLAGDRRTLADLALASAAAPLVQPPGYGAPVPAREAMPPLIQAASEALRRHPTGLFVQRLYRDHLVPPINS